jgi:lipoate-protein ligase A
MSVETWFYLATGPASPAFNMALDEALLEAAPALGQPLLRSYGWTLPAASFGYFQKIADVERLTPLRPLVRRPTGGGIVPHQADWTYSVVVPPHHPWYALRAEESYRRMHEWIRAAFAKLGVPTQPATDSRKPAPGECFAGWERFDLLWQRRKIAGAAQRRTRSGLLIQGSIQPPPGLRRAAWEDAMRAALEAHWASPPLEERLQQRAKELADQKYSQPAWNRKR